MIVEIADSTLKSDSEIKAKDYASSRIEDYWVLDLNNRQLYVYREPTEEGYQREVLLGENEAISERSASRCAPLQFPDCVIKVAEMLRPPDRVSDKLDES